MIIKGEIITTSGFSESHFGGLKRPYWGEHGRKDVQELKLCRNVIWGEFVTTSGFSEVILEFLKSPIGVSMVEKDVQELKSGRNVN